MKKLSFLLVILLNLPLANIQAERNISIVPTNASQPNFVAAYEYALRLASEGYKSADALHDTTLFSRYGQFSVYLGTSGGARGKFIVPMRATAELGQDSVATYDWTQNQHVALGYKITPASVLVFRTKELVDGYSASSGADFFGDVFKSYFFGDEMYKTVNEEELPAALVHPTARLLIIPDFTRKENDETYFAKLIASKTSTMISVLQSFLQRGGTIYAEGNGAYLLQALGLLDNGTFNYDNATRIEDVVPVTSSSTHLVATASDATGGKMYLYNIPEVSVGAGSEVIASYNSNPVLFERVQQGGKIVVNTGMPTFSGLQGLRATEVEKQKNGRQLQWFLNTLLYAHAYSVDATRKVRNEIKQGVTAAPNAVPYDEADDFEVQVTVRNLSEVAVSGITLNEVLPAELAPVIEGGGKSGDFTVSGQLLTTNLDLQAYEEQTLHYRLRMPKPNTALHDKLGDAISNNGLLAVTTESSVNYFTDNKQSTCNRPKAMAYVMLSADLYCDVDVNYKNPQGTFYQPFKVFMNVENKGRTAAKNVVYEQYIPIDLPVYWVDGAINIPILKTAGGKYVDILRGITNESDKNLSPADLDGHDLDLDGKPDVWIDQSSIYPKGYDLKDTTIYWRNPWDHFRGKPWLPKAQQVPCDPDSVYWFEDINHNGIYTCYEPNKGFYGYDTGTEHEVAEDTGDKLRAWKVVWNINTIPGLQTFEPFMSYEIWIDVPNLPQMAAGVAKAYGTMQKFDRQGTEAKDNTEYYYFPYHSFGANIPDIATIQAECPACDQRWKHWMNTNADSSIMEKRFVHTQRHEYLGYRWIMDDGATINEEIYNGTQKPYEELYGVTPVPRDAFNLITLLGGEDIDMDRFYSKRTEPTRIKYSTIFGEEKTLGMRTCYTFYAPLPNPLQFQYLSNSYEITDPNTGAILENLPYKGKANLNFYMAAATEYSYYWIREVGTVAGEKSSFGTVQYTPNANTWKYDYSKYLDGIPEAGDGVIGYLVYEIPKGMGGYRINLPHVNPNDPNSDFDVNKIVQVKTPRAKTNDAPANVAEGRQRFKQMMQDMEYADWEPIHHNENTPDDIRIFDDGVKYSIWIPQLLIPAALDDNNDDGIDDWMDDEGDRFYNADNQSYLPSFIPHGTGYDIEALGALNSSDTIDCHHDDGDMGYSLRGWCPGNDGVFGDDEFEELGKTYFKISAEYEGKGKEGPVTVSRGGILVTEEIFGGSPWVVYSHVLSGWAEGLDLRLSSQAVPYYVRFGNDTVLLKNTLSDYSELKQVTEQNADGSYHTSYNLSDPAHYFDNTFDPYHLTKSYDKGDVTITSNVGGKDPCSVIEPTENINLSAIINPNVKKSVTLLPMAAGNPELTALGYPKTIANEALVQVKVEFTNNTAIDWRNVELQTLIPDSLKNRLKVEMEYIAYPRPLVAGDNIGQFTAGFRFNEPEGEVLVKIGNVLPLIQPPRRAYYLVLLSVSDQLNDGVYEINFSMKGNKTSPATQQTIGAFDYAPPRALISVQRSATANRMVMGQTILDSLVIVPKDIYKPFGAVKAERVHAGEDAAASLAGYDVLTDTLAVTRGANSVVNLSAFGLFPTLDTRQVRVIEKAAVTSMDVNTTIENITTSQKLHYTPYSGQHATLSSAAVSVNTRGPKIVVGKQIAELNGKPYAEGDVLSADANGNIELALLVTATNYGLGAENVVITYTNEGLFVPLTDKIQQSCPKCIVQGNSVAVNFGTMMSGSGSSITIYYSLSAADLLGSSEQVNNVKNAPAIGAKMVPAQPSYAASASLSERLLVVRRGQVQFESSNDNRKYSYNDKDSVKVLFYELKPLDVTLTTEKIIMGKPSEFTAVVKNYAYPAQNVPVSIYAVKDADTLQIATGSIAQIDMGGVATITLQGTLPDARMVQNEKITLLLKVNDNFDIAELDYSNDNLFFEAEIGIPDMEDDGKLVIFPNPAVNVVNFLYDDCVLPVRKIEMCLYSIKGGKLACSKGEQCQTSWSLPDIKQGLYAVRVEITLTDGSKKQYLRRLAIGN